MEDEKFDQLTKKLALPLSRRGALKAVVASAVAGVAFRFGGGQAEAAGCIPIGSPCSSDVPCCPGSVRTTNAASNTCVCACPDSQQACGPCCCPTGTVCNTDVGTCVCPNTNPPLPVTCYVNGKPTCCPPPQICNVDGRCICPDKRVPCPGVPCCPTGEQCCPGVPGNCCPVGLRCFPANTPGSHAQCLCPNGLPPCGKTSDGIPICCPTGDQCCPGVPGSPGVPKNCCPRGTHCGKDSLDRPICLCNTDNRPPCGTGPNGPICCPRDKFCSNEDLTDPDDQFCPTPPGAPCCLCTSNERLPCANGVCCPAGTHCGASAFASVTCVCDSTNKPPCANGQCCTNNQICGANGCTCPNGQQPCVDANGNPNCCAQGCVCGTTTDGRLVCTRPTTCPGPNVATCASAPCPAGQVCVPPPAGCPDATPVCVSVCP
jgi:hypothetical protein